MATSDLDLDAIEASNASPELKAAARVDLATHGPYVARLTLNGFDWSCGYNTGGWHADGCSRDGNCGC